MTTTAIIMIKVEAKKNNLKDQYGEMFDYHFFSFFKFPENFLMCFNQICPLLLPLQLLYSTYHFSS